MVYDYHDELNLKVIKLSYTITWYNYHNENKIQVG